MSGRDWTAAVAIFVGLAGLAGGRIEIRISGRVVDPTYAPIANAVVKLQRAGLDTVNSAVSTGQDGAFSFPGEHPKKYELTVQCAGFVTIVKTIDATAGKDIDLGDLVMSVASIYGRTEATLVIQGIGGTSATLSQADLAKLPQQIVKTTDRGARVTFQGIFLTDVLSKVAVPIGDGFGGLEASHYLLVEARHGRRAVFAWTEVDTAFTDRPLYLVIKRDGKPLTDEEGPFELVVPGEKTNARWVPQVSALSIWLANGTGMPLLLDHHFRGLDDHGNGVAGLEVHLFGAAPRNDAFDLVLANLNYDVCHAHRYTHLDAHRAASGTTVAADCDAGDNAERQAICPVARCGATRTLTW
jgi:hypothetical protein